MNVLLDDRSGENVDIRKDEVRNNALQIADSSWPIPLIFTQWCIGSLREMMSDFSSFMLSNIRVDAGTNAIRLFARDLSRDIGLPYPIGVS